MAKSFPIGTYSITKAKGGEQKHFDADEDGYLSFMERQHYQTYQRFHFPLAKKKKMRPYDVDKDGMLNPAEFRLFERDKESGRLKEVVKSYKISLKQQKEKERLQRKAASFFPKK